MNISGLSAAEVNERIKNGKQNRSAAAKSKSSKQIVIENLFSVFNIIIMSIVLFLLAFYAKTGDSRLLLDGAGTASVAIINTLIAVIQEIRAKRALDKVNLLLKREVNVLRDGKTVSVDQSDIVLDDILILERGDQVVVDGSMVHSNHIEIDESLLTGESVPIFKKEGDEVLSGSFCVSGGGYYRAEKVGDDSYASSITKTAKKFKMNPSPLQVRLNFIVKSLFGVAVVLAMLEIIRTPGGFSDMDFVRKLSTILLSLVPQGLVLMASVTFALGVYRISKIGAIIQKLNAIESFANVKIVCTDKTGTLTQNKLAVNRITVLDNSLTEDDVKKLLGTYAKYSSDKNATLRTLEGFPSLDKVDAIDEIPFSSEKKHSLLKLNVDSKEQVFILGGFDILNEHSSKKQKTDEAYNSAGLKIYRNILFGQVNTGAFDELKNNGNNVTIEPICIISITDQVRDDVMDAINLFLENGIEVKILSGDAAVAVQAVAKEIGWDIKDDELINGSEIDNVKEEDLSKMIMQKKIFARLRPDHKLRIIKALKREKIHTAMIGDGVNDLPAIKESDMGIAMEEGSKITKEVADIVLLKNKFALLPSIFDEGNRIVNTVSAASKLFLTKNFMVVYLTLLSLFLAWDFPLTPRRVSLINIFAIGLPAFIIALKNANVSKALHFTKDLFSFVFISALIIVVASYIGQFRIQKLPLYTEPGVQMAMLSIMIIITAANFLSISFHKKEKHLLLYVCYALGLVGLYMLLALTKIDFVLFNILKKFYEISYLEPQYIETVLLISAAAAAILLVVQQIRRKIIFK